MDGQANRGFTTEIPAVGLVAQARFDGCSYAQHHFSSASHFLGLDMPNCNPITLARITEA